MIRINQLKLPIKHTDEQLELKIRNILKLTPEHKLKYQIVKKSIDARKKPDLKYVYAVDVQIEQEHKILKKVNDNNIMLTSIKKYSFPLRGTKKENMRPAIIGAGPAGLFCSYILVQNGYHPLIIERGKKVEDRTRDVMEFWENGILNPSSNVQFGEGGAGTFSDGKLNTLVKDPAGRNRFILETFVKYGAPERILYENKPHIGTDILTSVIKNMRMDMQAAGAQFLFETCVTDLSISDGKITGLLLNGVQWQNTGCCVLAIGHSARDTFRMLAEKPLRMEAKSFAVGFRVEHPQKDINLSQYGERYADILPAAPYKITANFPDGRGVYSFCMCPGGFVVNASSEAMRLAVNGMSYADRNGTNANSAIIVSVTPDDFDKKDALSGVRFQEKLEEKAYLLGNGCIPQQLFSDYCRNRSSISYGSFESAAKGKTLLCNLRGLLPACLEDTFIQGMHHFSHSIPGFDREDAILSGIESRTSSPLRISRNDAFEADIKGLYPCGEGAGYAGGIMSAAMDGMKVAEAIIKHETHF